jgi:membrane-associated protein
MSFIRHLIDIFFHLDRYLSSWTGTLGGWVYLILFVVVFCETGLVVTPFLPGDSLLFAVGAIASIDGSPLNVFWAMAILGAAAVIGDAVNYSIGLKIGPRVFHSETSRWLNRKHLQKAQSFYERYGGKTIVLARFIPIIRTFAPFVAGIGKMTYRRFALFNITGGLAWVVTFTLAGYKFGQVKFVKDRFHYVIVAIIIISILPAVIEFLRERRRSRTEPRRAA